MSYLCHQIKVGQRGRTRLPHSEVCIHMRVTDKYMDFVVVSDRAVQLYNDDGTPFSSPILTSEAGLFSESEGCFYYYPHGYDTPCDERASLPPEKLTE